MTTITAYDFTLADRIQAGLQKCVGKANACKSSVMIRKLAKDDFKVNGAKIREIIHYLRTVRGVFICGDSHGYYVPASDEEVTRQINSMKSRIREITEACNALIKAHEKQYKQVEIF